MGTRPVVCAVVASIVTCSNQRDGGDLVNLEKRGVNTISRLLEHCANLDPMIDMNDRTPLTDGFIDVYEAGKLGKKDNLEFRVGVQVKTKSIPKKSRVPLSYKVSVVDLRGWQRLGGVILFVVHCDLQADIEYPRYTVLGPLQIQRILDDVAQKQLTVTIPTKSLPDEEEEIERLVRFAAQSQRDLVTLSADSPFLSAAESLILYSDARLDLEHPLTLDNTETEHLLLVTLSTGETFALAGDLEITPGAYLPTEVDWTFSSGGIQFETAIRRRIDAQSVEFQLSPGLAVVLITRDEGLEVRLNYSAQSSFLGRLRDLQFLLACAGGAVLTIGTVQMEPPREALKGQGDLEEHLGMLARLQRLFEALQVDSSLVELDELSDSELRQLLSLSSYVLDGQNLPAQYRTSNRVRQPVAGWSIELLCVPDPENDGHWLVRSLLDPDLNYIFAADRSGGEGEPDRFLITAHDAVADEVFPRTINLRLDQLPESYGAIFTSEESPRLANEMVLKLISAAAVDPSRHVEFLDAARELNEWLIEQQGNKSEHLINRWQILDRTSGLTKDDEVQLRQLRRQLGKQEGDEATIAVICCDILLRDAGNVEYLISELETTVLDRLQTWPIWALHQAAGRNDSGARPN